MKFKNKDGKKIPADKTFLFSNLESEEILQMHRKLYGPCSKDKAPINVVGPCIQKYHEEGQLLTREVQHQLDHLVVSTSREEMNELIASVKNQVTHFQDWESDKEVIWGTDLPYVSELYQFGSAVTSATVGGKPAVVLFQERYQSYSDVMLLAACKLIAVSESSSKVPDTVYVFLSEESNPYELKIEECTLSWLRQYKEVVKNYRNLYALQNRIRKALKEHRLESAWNPEGVQNRLDNKKETDNNLSPLPKKYRLPRALPPQNIKGPQGLMKELEKRKRG